jgi:alpha-1,2-mannosyltransferase
MADLRWDAARFWRGVLRVVRRPEAWIALAALAFFALENHNGRFHQTDFRSYYEAARHFVHAEPLYFVTDQVAAVPFLYPPAAALLFVPWLCLDIGVATIVWYWLTVVCFLVVWWMLCTAIGPLGSGRTFAFFLTTAVVVERELHVGNVNLLTLVLCLLAIEGVTRHTPAGAAISLIGAIVCKPPNALLAIPLAIRSQKLPVPLALGALVAIAIPLPVYGRNGAVHLYGEFLRSAANFAERFADTPKFASTTAGLLHTSAAAFGYALDRTAAVTVGGACAAAILIVLSRRTDSVHARAFGTLALVPLSVPSDHQVFILAAPLVYLLLYRWRMERWTTRRVVLLLSALVLYGCNWHDLWGASVSEAYYRLGLQGAATWGLLLLTATGQPKQVARRATATTLHPREEEE